MSKLKFTDEQLKELHSRGLNDGEMGKVLGGSRASIRQRRIKLNLPPNGTRYQWPKYIHPSRIKRHEV